MDLIVIGKATLAMPEKSGVSQRGEWKSRQYVMETQEQYPRKVVFEVFGSDKLQQFNIHSNDIIRVHLEIEAREYNGKWYNNVRAWNVEHVNPDGSIVGAQPAPQQQTQPANPSYQSPAPAYQPTQAPASQQSDPDVF